METPTKKLWLRRSIPITFYGLFVVFLYLYLRSVDLSKLQHLDISLVYLLVASVLALAARFWGACIWFMILRNLGANIARAKIQLVYVYAKSWMGRYIPGTAPWILGKIYFASQHGISRNKLAVSSLLEGGLQIVVTMVLAFLLFIFDKRLDVINGSIKIAMTAVILAGVISLIPAIFNTILGLAYRILRKKMLADEHLATNKTVLTASALYVIYTVISGLSLFFIAKAVYPALAYHNLPFVVGVTSLAASVSMLALFAPSGLGVREGIQLILLDIIMPRELALVITVVSRLWSVVVDLTFFGISHILQKYYHGSSQKT